MTTAQREAVARMLDNEAGEQRGEPPPEADDPIGDYYLALADRIIAAYEAEAPQRWDCQICGGVVDLSNPVAPTVSFGKHHQPKKASDA